MLFNRKSMKFFLKVTVCMTVIIFMAGVIGAEMKKAGEKKGLKVTVLLFSGRPDPVYKIDDKDMIEKIKTILGEAKIQDKFEKPTVIPSLLGYKGIVVDNKERVAGLPAFFAVYKGDIEVKNEMKKFLIDEGNTLENLLLDEAIKAGVIDEKIQRLMKLER